MLAGRSVRLATIWRAEDRQALDGRVFLMMSYHPLVERLDVFFERVPSSWLGPVECAERGPSSLSSCALALRLGSEPSRPTAAR